MRYARADTAILWLALLCLAVAQAAVSAATKRLSGPDIYRQHCVKCHGKSGEGVKTKYDDALVGDWSVDKLTRYIDKTMPEGAPEKIDHAQSAAVAQFIHDTFYSREARARNNPARVDLVRLTNRQHLLTVADLLKRFIGDDAPLPPARGLQATYYNSRRAGRGDTATNRVDRQVQFDFGTNNPVELKPGIKEFSMQWEGSLIAPETGEYEFSLHTPNGCRLWINGEDTPLIDGSVASGEFSDHKGKIRLIGGRAYPLRLSFFKTDKDKTASIALQWKPPHGVLETIPARNLSPARTTPTFVISTPFPADDSSAGYERGVFVSKSWDEATTQAAIETASHVAQNLDRYTRSKSTDGDRAAKVEAFCQGFVQLAFRRPLTDEQKHLYVQAPLKSAGKVEDGVKRVVLLALKSPQFLYIGLDRSKSDDFEVATRLSYGLWDSLPDVTLRELAAQGALRTRDQVSKEAQRMLVDPRARAKMAYFLQQWLQMNHVEDFSKDSSLFPGFSPEIVADLRESLKLFLDDVIWSPSSDYRRLLLEDDLFVNDRLSKFYGINTNANDDFIKISLNPKERSGVVTHPYLLAAFSYQKTSSPIHRGVFLTRNIVGRALKPPPVAVAFEDAKFRPDMTMREKVDELTRATACQGCHSVINPLGFSLENYDAVGRFRTKEGNRPIDAVSEYQTDEGRTITFKGARDLAEFAVASEHAQNGFIEQLFHQVVKQPVLAYGPDTLKQLRQSFLDSGYSVQKLLVEIATVSALHHDAKPVKAK